MVHVTFELLFCLPMWLETILELIVENYKWARWWGRKNGMKRSLFGLISAWWRKNIIGGSVRFLKMSVEIFKVTRKVWVDDVISCPWQFLIMIADLVATGKWLWMVRWWGLNILTNRKRPFSVRVGDNSILSVPGIYWNDESYLLYYICLATIRHSGHTPLFIGWTWYRWEYGFWFSSPWDGNSTHRPADFRNRFHVTTFKCFSKTYSKAHSHTLWFNHHMTQEVNRHSRT